MNLPSVKGTQVSIRLIDGLTFDFIIDTMTETWVYGQRSGSPRKTGIMVRAIAMIEY